MEVSGSIAGLENQLLISNIRTLAFERQHNHNIQLLLFFLSIVDLLFY